MIPIDQRTESDCLRCCIASIFELPYEAVPYFGPVYEYFTCFLVEDPARR
jgi:hypothetical protein